MYLNKKAYLGYVSIIKVIMYTISEVTSEYTDNGCVMKFSEKDKTGPEVVSSMKTRLTKGLNRLFTLNCPDVELTNGMNRYIKKVKCTVNNSMFSFSQLFETNKRIPRSQSYYSLRTLDGIRAGLSITFDLSVKHNVFTTFAKSSSSKLAVSNKSIITDTMNSPELLTPQFLTTESQYSYLVLMRCITENSLSSDDNNNICHALYDAILDASKLESSSRYLLTELLRRSACDKLYSWDTEYIGIDGKNPIVNLRRIDNGFTTKMEFNIDILDTFPGLHSELVNKGIDSSVYGPYYSTVCNHTSRSVNYKSSIGGRRNAIIRTSSDDTVYFNAVDFKDVDTMERMTGNIHFVHKGHAINVPYYVNSPSHNASLQVAGTPSSLFFIENKIRIDYEHPSFVFFYTLYSMYSNEYSMSDIRSMNNTQFLNDVYFKFLFRMLSRHNGECNPSKNMVYHDNSTGISYVGFNESTNRLASNYLSNYNLKRVIHVPVVSTLCSVDKVKELCAVLNNS